MKTLDIKKVTKTVSAIMLSIMMVMILSNIVFAVGATDPAQISAQEASTGMITKIGGQIITIVSVIGSVVSIIILIVLGLKYMMGSAEEKAEYKKTLMPYVIGASLVFAASAIAGLVYNFADSISKTVS